MICSYSKEYAVSAYTDVENAFLSEYMPISDGDAVKVYLYGLYLCRNPQIEKSLSEIAETLRLTPEQVKEYFTYWEDFGLCSVISKEPFEVVFMPVRTAHGVKPRKYKTEKYTEFSKGVQTLLPGRMISTGEFTEYYGIMETFSIKPDAMLMIVKYCVDRKGNDIGYHYISKVAKDFGIRGITTVEKVEKELSSYILRTSEIQRVLKALSLKRQPEIEDLNYIKKWTEELGFDMDNVVCAAKSLKKGNIAKLDEFLLELYSIKCFSKEEIEAYIKNKQEIYDLTLKINRALSVYLEVLDPEIETYTRKWLSYGFDGETLLYVADRCFKDGKNKLPLMDELLEDLFKKGIIGLSSVSDYFEDLKKTDEFIKKLLATAGVNRRPNDWDRQNVAMWKSWNFSEDMILQAAALSSGKSSPIPYMNGILANWKNSGVYSLSEVPEDKTISISQADYNSEYEKRRNKALLAAQKNIDAAMEIEGFGKVYSRLNSIEKDLALAEMSGNQEMLTSYEKEKADLSAKMTEMLAEIGLTPEDLLPKYACNKCNDTGYVGTHRCDCFDKKS